MVLELASRHLMGRSLTGLCWVEVNYSDDNAIAFETPVGRLFHANDVIVNDVLSFNRS